MNISDRQSQIRFVVEVRPVERWAIYHRLQELEIKCDRPTNQPLKVEIISPTEAMQLWSTVKHATASRHELIRWLEKCWHKSTKINE